MTRLQQRDHKYNLNSMEVTRKSDELDSLKFDLEFEEKRLVKMKLGDTALNGEDLELEMLEKELKNAEEQNKIVNILFDQVVRNLTFLTRSGLDEELVNSYVSYLSERKEKALEYVQEVIAADYEQERTKIKRKSQKSMNTLKIKEIPKTINRNNKNAKREASIGEDSELEEEEKLIKKQRDDIFKDFNSIKTKKEES